MLQCETQSNHETDEAEVKARYAHYRESGTAESRVEMQLA